jgi:thiamine biosynthesis lipoprotein
MIHHISFRAMGGMCEVVLAAGSRTQALALAQPAIDEVHRIEHKYSRYRDDSVVSMINAAAGGSPVLCDEETWSLLNFADQLHQQSDGLFDITSGVLRQAWNFAAPELPSATTLEGLCALVGWSDVERDGQQIRLPRRGMEIDFGGFGKEYATDRAAQVLRQQGVEHGYTNLAGDMRFMGPKPSGEPWMIGIQDPRVRERVAATLPMRQGGLATSGDYERYFELDGKRYCHVLNPFTGEPVRYWQTVSVTAPMAVMAGCCSTIAMLMQEQGLAFLESSGFDFFAINHQGHVHTKT